MRFVEVRGTQTINKGAQLMLESIVERLDGRWPIAAPPIGTDYRIHGRLGIYQTLHEYKIPRVSQRLGDLVPAKIAARYGMVRDRDIFAVLDASGFAYSDSFGAQRSRREALFGRTWQKRGIPKIMLPQAFGPFADAETGRWAREVLSQAELIFARDRVSADYLRALDSGLPVHVSPDFTIGLTPALTPALPVERFVAIVPNAKMVSSGTRGKAEYVSELARYAAAAAARGHDCLIVVHETGDTELANALSAAAGGIPTFYDPDPRVLKAVLGAADAVVSSRFHAVVGALSQGVPTVALGWSHKYEELLRDFGVPQWKPASDDSSENLDRVLGDDEAVAVLAERGTDLKRSVDEMWQKVFAVLERAGGRS